MPRENIHYGGWEHRDLHNINGMLFVSVCNSHDLNIVIDRLVHRPT